MSPLLLKEPLTEAELDRLAEFLQCSDGEAMNVEELDGFFAALVVGPEVVLPSEYLPELFGGEMHQFQSLDQANDILGLLMRHWNDIAATLAKDEVYRPIILEHEDGVAYGNEWAWGFMQGMAMRREGWKTLLADEDHAGCIVPMLMLYHEHDEDESLRPAPIGREQREALIEYVVAGLLLAYRYFRQRWRAASLASDPAAHGHLSSSIGRNEPCPCGSGRKYKRCCGATGCCRSGGRR